jgi:hypothetical protein
MGPTSGAVGLTAELFMWSKPYVQTDAAIHIFERDTIRKPAVEILLNRLVEHGGNRYKFSDAGEGCRF